MRRALVFFGILAAPLALAAGLVEETLKADPVEDATRSFAAGDRRSIVLPICTIQGGEVLPGWPLEYSPEHLRALETGKRPFTCADLGDITDTRAFLRVAKYAERYNQTLLRLSSKPNK